MPAETLEQIVSLCKRRGFVYPGSAVYGGFSASWDYGPLGVELKNNIKRQWWMHTVQLRDDVEGIDCALIMNPQVWVHSGHVGTFSDPLVDNRKTKKRYRLDHLLEAQHPNAVRALARALLFHITGMLSAADRVRQAVASAKRRRGVAAEAHTLDEVMLAQHEEEIQADVAKLTSSMVPGEYALLCEDLLSSLHVGDHKNLAGGCARFLVSVKEFPAEKWLAEMHVIDPETGEPGDWTAPRQFNLMFDTHIGPIKDDEHKAFLRPETAQGMFVNFKNVLDTMRRRLPFGISQVGRSFRNEITPGNFIFRQREFEQMEIEYFVMPEEAEGKYFDWIAYRRSWWEGLGVAPERLRTREHAKDELAHYAAACSDIEYLFPGSLGWNELEGIANRTNYDLTAHSKDNEVVAAARAKFGMESPNTDSVETLTYYDEKSKTHLIPFVIEPAAGVDRAFLTFLCDAYCEELVGEIAEADRKAVREALEAFVKSVGKKLEASKRGGVDTPVHQSGSVIQSGAKNPVAPSVDKSVHPPSGPSADKLAAMLEMGNAILAGGDAAFARISTLLSLPGAEQIELGKKLRGVAERVVDGAFRTVLKLHPKLSPIKVAIFPLKKNHEGIVAKAKDILRDLKPHMKAVYDDTGAIGKLYRRQDEIGTPFCITVDFQSLEDGTVTVRDRDSMSQERVGAGVLREWLEKRVG